VKPSGSTRVFEVACVMTDGFDIRGTGHRDQINVLSNNRLKLTARGRSVAKWWLRSRAAA
jgi:hypothetical protein